MIVEFKENHYVNVDEIQALRKFDADGVCVVGGQKIRLTGDEFDIIKKAFHFQHDTHMYDKKLRKIKR